ncbi:hypothetical protein [Caudoviricetes sp.]|nr:hypothetical protein [Caudoviricetes sp.]
MSLFTLSSGESAVTTKTEFSSETKLIPDGSILLFNISDVLHKDEQEFQSGDTQEEHEAVKLECVDKDYRGTILTLKLYLYSDNDRRRDRAVSLLATLDAISGNKLSNAEAKGKTIDTRALRTVLVGQELMVTVGIFDAGNDRKYNTVQAIRGVQKNSKIAQENKAIMKKASEQPQAPDQDYDFNDEIPF